MRTRLIIAPLFALTLASTAAQPAKDIGSDGTHAMAGSESLITLSATVAAVNLEKREVTLMDAQGDSQVIIVSDEVKNLPQIAVGDRLDVTYYESVTFEVLAPGEANANVAAAAVMDTAQPGEKPAAAATSELSFVATVEAIDKAAGTVDLKGPEGNTRTVRVNNPENLDKVAVGDELLITVTNSIAVEVSGASEN